MKLTLALATAVWALGGSAHAEPPCWQIRLYVTVYGEKKAIQWAYDHGYGRAEIAEARLKCGLGSR